jgi:hypothetical protein
MERFRNHTALDLPVNRYVKQIVNPRWITRFSVHEHILVRGAMCRHPTGELTHYEIHERKAVQDVLRINHYWTKSTEEFIAKRMHGVSTDPEGWMKAVRRIPEHIEMAKDVVLNDTKIDWAIPLVKANMAARRSSLS